MTVNLPWLIHLAHIDCLLACVLDYLNVRINYALCSATPHPSSSQEAVFITEQLQEGVNIMWSTPILNTMGAQKLSRSGRDARRWGMKRAEMCNWRMCNSQEQTEHQLASASTALGEHPSGTQKQLRSSSNLHYSPLINHITFAKQNFLKFFFCISP